MHATLIHGQAASALSKAQQDQIVGFESGIFTAQSVDTLAYDLNSDGATGGPKALFTELAQFFIGINDPLGMNPRNEPFNPNIFNLYSGWDNRSGQSNGTPRRASIARGETIFNTKRFQITGVAGLNDISNGSCGICHDTPNVGNHSVKAPLNIGVAGAGGNTPPALDTSGLPVFTLECTSGPLNGQQFVVTDPGRALITGNCADIGKFKGPILRGLASRAPYFHNGSAATLDDAVEFYNQRFSIGFTEQEKRDLVNFLNAL
jgi:hypothetical protein